MRSCLVLIALVAAASASSSPAWFGRGGDPPGVATRFQQPQQQLVEQQQQPEAAAALAELSSTVSFHQHNQQRDPKRLTHLVAKAFLMEAIRHASQDESLLEVSEGATTAAAATVHTHAKSRSQLRGLAAAHNRAHQRSRSRSHASSHSKARSELGLPDAGEMLETAARVEPANANDEAPAAAAAPLQVMDMTTSSGGAGGAAHEDADDHEPAAETGVIGTADIVRHTDEQDDGMQSPPPAISADTTDQQSDNFDDARPVHSRQQAPRFQAAGSAGSGSGGLIASAAADQVRNNPTDMAYVARFAQPVPSAKQALSGEAPQAWESNSPVGRTAAAAPFGAMRFQEVDVGSKQQVQVAAGKNPADIEDCTGCKFIWSQVEMDVGSARFVEDVQASFEHNCMDAQKSTIFYGVCEDMYDDVYAFTDDYMSNKFTVAQMCGRAKICI